MLACARIEAIRSVVFAAPNCCRGSSLGCGWSPAGSCANQFKGAVWRHARLLVRILRSMLSGKHALPKHRSAARERRLGAAFVSSRVRWFRVPG